MGVRADQASFNSREDKRASRSPQRGMAHSTEKDKIETRKDDHLIEIKETKERIDKMFENLGNSSSEMCTIFKVNVGLRESNPDAYTPKMVSIGPYHKKNPQLVPMEKYKLLYLRRFLKRNEGLDVESCISKLQKLKEKALKCYNDITDDDNQFCQMLLLDGCFVIEFTRERNKMCPQGEDRIIDPNLASYIFRDLMLLENQLPFFVLNQLYCMTKKYYEEESLVTLVNNLSTRFSDMLKMTRTLETEYNVGNIKHLLHLVHIFSCHGNPKKYSNDDIITCQKVMPNATELFEAGVNFAKVNNMTSLLDIKFENGLMEIPCFRVEDGTETLMRNLIAYEQQSSDEDPIYFSDYATFMNNLMDSDKDVNLLRRKGIIENWIGDDKQVASLFNKLGNGVTTYPNFYYNEEFKKAVEHCETPWHRMKANLKHNYFTSPWVGASTVAAIILLILTTIQTILAFTGPIK